MGYTIDQLQKMGAKPVAPASLSPANGGSYTLQQLQGMGATPVQPPPAPHQSIFGKIGQFASDVFKGATAPVVTLAARPWQLAKAIGGATEEQQAVNLPYYGKIETSKNASDVVKDIGRGVETVALGYGGGAARDVAGNLIKETTKQAIKRGAIEGVKAGGAFGFGQALEEGGTGVTPGEVLKKTAIGAGFGGVVGGTVPAAVAGVGGITSAIGRRAAGGAETATKTISPRVSRAIDELEMKYQDIERGWVQTRKASEKATRVTQLKNKAGTIGRTPERVLAENGIIPDHVGTEFTTKAQSAKLRDQVTPLAQANKRALQEVQLSTTPVSIDDLETRAIARVRSPENVAAGLADDMEKGIRAQMDGYRKNYGQTIPLSVVDDIKSARWGQTGFHLTREDKLASDINYALGKTAQETIEEIAAKAGATDVAQLNREIGDILEGAKFLENLDGKKVLYGRMGTHMIRLAGTIAGSRGGFIGSIAGYAGGDLVAKMLRSLSIATPVKRLILRNLEKTNPAAYLKTMNWLRKQGLDRELRLALPPAHPFGSAERPFITPERVKPSITSTKAPPFGVPDLSLQPHRLIEAPFGSPQKPHITPPPKSIFSRKTPSEPKPPGAPAVPALPKKGNVQFLNRAKAIESANPEFKGFSDLTTKFLDYAKGKTTVSKQEILDFARRPKLKKGEADLLNNLAKDLPEGKIPAQEFADSIKAELLPLKSKRLIIKADFDTSQMSRREIAEFQGAGGAQFEGIRIKTGNPKNYEEVVFESPITTNGSSHYPNFKKYFAHARGDEVVEGGKKIWREQEIQSDLLQKEGLEQARRITPDMPTTEKNLGEYVENARKQKDFRNQEISKLEPFTNDRFGKRIMPERIKEKAQKGYEKYRLPTGETIGKIEGFRVDRWFGVDKTGGGDFNKLLKVEDLSVGKVITQDSTGRHMDDWIITDILGDGRFKAVPKENLMDEAFLKTTKNPKYTKENLKKLGDNWYSPRTAETFDLTGKSNPQYRRYSDWGKFLKNKYGGKEITDPQGNTWIEVDIKPEYKKLPIEAFAAAPLVSIFGQRKEEKQSIFAKK